MDIEFIDCVSGEYEVLIVDEVVFYEGHKIPKHIYIKLFEKLGVKALERIISDEDMESGSY